MKNINEQIFRQIDKATNILITGSVKWNEEIIASGLALHKFLAKINKQSDIIFDFSENKYFLNPPVDQFSILSGFKDIKTEYNNNGFVISLDISKIKIENIRYKASKDSLDFFITSKNGTFSSDNVKTSSNSDYDLIIVLGTSDIDSMNVLYKNSVNIFYEIPVINIDNKASNEEFGQINFVNLLVTSVAELLLFLFIKYDKNLIDKEVADSLLTSIIYTTNNFKSNVIPATLEDTACLLNLKADKDKIVEKMYKSFSFDLLKLWGRAFSRIKEHFNFKTFAWTVILENDFLETKTNASDLVRLFNEIRISLSECKIVILFYERRINNRLYSNALIYHHTSLNISASFMDYKTSNDNNIFQINSEKSISNLQKDVIKKISRILKNS